MHQQKTTGLQNTASDCSFGGKGSEVLFSVSFRRCLVAGVIVLDIYSSFMDNGCKVTIIVSFSRFLVV